MLRPYENQYNWKGLEFPVSIKEIHKFEKNTPDMAVNVLFSNNKTQKKKIYIYIYILLGWSFLQKQLTTECPFAVFADVSVLDV